VSHIRREGHGRPVRRMLAVVIILAALASGGGEAVYVVADAADFEQVECVARLRQMARRRGFQSYSGVRRRAA
jgi:hypothetical protein